MHHQARLADATACAQEEVDGKTRKLKKLLPKYQAAKAEIKDLQEEFQREKEVSSHIQASHVVKPGQVGERAYQESRDVKPNQQGRCTKVHGAGASISRYRRHARIRTSLFCTDTDAYTK